LAAGAIALAAAPAGAHALAQSSDPPAGATLQRAPTEVTVTFGEQPDAKLSSLRVLDTGGQDHTTGHTSAVPGHPLELGVAVGPLGKGVYTVSWRTLSRVDGHLAAGTFAFGVGVAPTGTATAAFTARAPLPSAGSVAARWALYLGLMLLVGGVFVGLVCLPALPERLRLLLATGWGLAAVGAAGIAFDAWRRARFPLAKLLSSSIGHQLADRVVPLVVTGVLLGLAYLPLLAHFRRRVVALVGIGALAAMWGDVQGSHAAAARSWRLGRMVIQAVHFAAAGIWVGGLLALLLTVGALAAQERQRAVRRYSTVALACVAVVAASGAQRAYDEVGTLHRLVTAAFGQYVLVKVGLLVILVGLGALNRYRSVPAAARTLRPLRRVAGAETVAFAVVLGITGILQGLAPPSSQAAGSNVKPIVLVGHDFATTTRVRLTISPGTAGFNTFVLTAIDYDTAKPIQATASLRFTLPARPELGGSMLALTAQTAPGTFAASGANLSINGAWNVTVVLQEATGGVEIPFTVTPRVPPEKITVQKNPGLPPLYTLELAGNRSVQTYLDPGHRVPINEFHVTFIGPDGNELAMTGLTVDATPGGRLTVRRLDDIGHFVADLPGAVKGPYRFGVTGTAKTGDTVTGTFTIRVT
jgi:copper transport protein